MSKQEGLELGMLMDSARRFLAGRREGILRGSCSDSEGAAALWRECAELGWLLTCVPPDADGAGMGTSALAILAEELGRALYPLPVGRAMAVAALLAEIDTAGAQPAWLTDWLAGETPLGVVEGRVVRHACGTPGVRASHAAGEVIFELVETGAAGFGLDPLVAVGRAGAVQSAVRFKCPPSNWQTFEFRSRIALLAEALGAASGALELAVAYACERTQFGRPIGAFQAIKHPLANIRMAIDDARLTLHDACEAVDARRSDGEQRLLMAELLVMEAAQGSVEQAIQTHGAMGFTWECPVHFHFKRVKHLAAILRQTHDSSVILDRLWHMAG